jgi:hypothetical protein
LKILWVSINEITAYNNKYCLLESSSIWNENKQYLTKIWGNCSKYQQRIPPNTQGVEGKGGRKENTRGSHVEDWRGAKHQNMTPCI